MLRTDQFWSLDNVAYRGIPGRVAVYAIIFAVFFFLAGAQFNHNDFLYAVAPLRHGALFRDVHYVQGPI